MKKINRLLAFLLAFTVVITTFSSDYATAHVYATEEETLQNADDTIKTADWEAVDGEKASATNVSVEGSTEESVEASTEGTTTEVEGTAKPEGDGVVTGENNDAATAGTVGEVTNPETVVATEDGEVKESDDNDKFDSEAKELKETVDGIDIFVSADAGVLPTDAELRVAKVDSDDEEKIQNLIDDATGEDVTVEETISFDINIYSKSEGDPENNNYVQPKGDVEVRFESVEAAESEDVALSVYHVNDDIDEAVPMSDEVTGDKTEVAIETSHFSIYTVTIINKDREITIYQADTNFNVISWDDKTASISDGETAENIGKMLGIPGGYSSFAGLYAKFGRDVYEISSFKIVDGRRKFYTTDNRIGNVHDYYIYAIYLPENTTSHHIDLGLTGEEFSKYYDEKTKKPIADVYVYIDGTEHKMTVDREVYKDRYEGKDYFEFRYSSKSPISVNSDISFKVVLGNTTYTMTGLTTDDNKNAYERCYKAHWKEQTTFGFDYISDLKEFEVTSKVTYHSNGRHTKADGTELTNEIDNVKVKEKYTVLSYTDALDQEVSAEFLGWYTAPVVPKNGTLISVGSKVDVPKAGLDLYAVWQKYNVTFKDYLDKKVEYTNYNKVVFAGDKVADPGKLTTTKTINNVKYKFDNWYLVGTDGKLSSTPFDFANTAITKDTTIYANWVPDTYKVAVYVTDGNPQSTLDSDVAKKLNLGYVQGDHYYPVGVIELPADIFAGHHDRYIRTENDLKTVLAAIKNIDVSDGVLKRNNNNTVAKNLDKVLLDTNNGNGYGPGQYKTALFNWDGPEYDGDGSIVNPDDPNGRFQYHLDLRFDTDFVEYYRVFFKDGQYQRVDTQPVYKEAFLKGSQKTVTTKDFEDVEGYQSNGLYLNQFCWNNTRVFKNQNIYSNKVYVKYTNTETEKNYTVNFFYQKADGRYDYFHPNKTKTYTVSVPVDSRKFVKVSAHSVLAEDTSKDFAFETDETAHITTFSKTFTDASGVVYTEDKNNSEYWYEYNLRNNNEIATLNVYFKRVVPSNYKIVIKASVDGKDRDTTLVYNGKPQHANMAVSVTAEKIGGSSDNHHGFFDWLLSSFTLGVLHVSAAETNVPDETLDLGRINVTVSGLRAYDSDDQINVGDYPFYLDQSKMKVTTKVGDQEVDITKAITIEVVTPEIAETEENTVRANATTDPVIGYLHITPAHVTVTASTGLSKTAGSSDPTFTATVTVDEENITEEERTAITEEANNSVVHGVARQTGESTGNYVVKLYGPKDKEYTERTDEAEVQGNFIATYVPGVFTINSAPSNREEEESTPENPETPVEFVPLAAAPGVLGAQRALPGEAPAVLGARRSGTSDTNILGSIITIIVAAASAFSMVFIKRKKKEEN